MGIYYLQKKYRLDSKGNKHLNYNITIPKDVINAMDLDHTDRTKRKVDVAYDDATKTVTIRKVV